MRVADSGWPCCVADWPCGMGLGALGLVIGYLVIGRRWAIVVGTFGAGLVIVSWGCMRMAAGEWDQYLCMPMLSVQSVA